MYTNLLIASTIGLASLAAAVPFSFPNPDTGKFPAITNPSPELTQIELAAHGSLPNGSPPDHISDDTKLSLRFIAFNELFEVAFFTELLHNITTGAPGYQNIPNQSFTVNALKAVLAQEELHVLNANGALAHFGEQPIQPCKYNFPVSKFEDAIALASTFTDLVLGTLQDVTTLLGSDGDAALIRGVASVIGQEGEQNGFYRSVEGKIPSALPFLTASTRDIAFSAVNQGFVVKGSCPNINEIKLNIFNVLTLETQNVGPSTKDVTFSIALADSQTASSYTSQYGKNYEKLSVVFINQQNKPIYQQPENVVIKSNKVEFTVKFPFDGVTFGNGLTIAVLATGPAATSVDDVAKATQFGPALIEIN